MRALRRYVVPVCELWPRLFRLGAHTISMYYVQLMAMSLSKKDVAMNPNPLDLVTLGDHKLGLASSIRMIGVAFTNGFTINIPPGPILSGFNVAIQTALVWASQNVPLLDVMNVQDWIPLPAIAAANHNHYRFQFTVGMFVHGGLFTPLVEFACFMGYIHSVNSRGNGSRFAEVVTQQENFVMATGTVQTSMRAALIAQTIAGFTLPHTQS